MTDLRGLIKVPLRITAIFWVTKVLTTAMGEAFSDYLVHRFNPVPAAAIGVLLFVVAMAWQFATRRYNTWVYWFAVAMVAVFGTMVADGPHKQLGIPYPVTTVVYAVVLAVIFYAWDRREHTLSIHSITTRPREVFYWLAVLATFALGTAAGDLTAATLHLGYGPSALLFGAVMLIPAVAYRWFGMNPILAFWFAYVFTRPFGASIADWLGKPYHGGLGWGDGTVALLFTALIVVAVALTAWSKVDVRTPLHAAIEPAPD